MKFLLLFFAVINLISGSIQIGLAHYGMGVFNFGVFLMCFLISLSEVD